MSNTQLSGDFVNPRVSSPLGCNCCYTMRADGSDRKGVVCAEHVAQELSQSVQAEKERLVEAVQMIPETFEVENDGELLEIRKGISDYKQDVLQALTQESE